MTIDQFSNLPVQLRQEELFKCCGSERWVEKLLGKFPVRSIDELKKESDKIWFSLGEDDWKEAFSHHPKIGDVESLQKKFVQTATWAEVEQANVKQASLEVLQDLQKGNEAYEKKFGYIFIVCATGKSAEEMLSLLQKRLINNPAYEIKIAAEEQNKITHLRIEKLFA